MATTNQERKTMYTIYGFNDHNDTPTLRANTLREAQALAVELLNLIGYGIVQVFDGLDGEEGEFPVYQVSL